jgi:hypothetical protein
MSSKVLKADSLKRFLNGSDLVLLYVDQFELTNPINMQSFREENETVEWH